jgi:hypothetical protein
MTSIDTNHRAIAAAATALTITAIPAPTVSARPSQSSHELLTWPARPERLSASEEIGQRNRPAVQECIDKIVANQQKMGAAPKALQSEAHEPIRILLMACVSTEAPQTTLTDEQFDQLITFLREVA